MKFNTVEGQFSYDALGQRTCLKCGAAICAGCTPDKCGTPCEECQAMLQITPDDLRLQLRAETKWKPEETARQQELIAKMLSDAEVGARAKRLGENFRRMDKLVAEHDSDIEFAGYVRGVRFGVFITVGFILALGAAVRIGVAIWEMVR